jgi:putative ABC transport system permease protein
MAHRLPVLRRAARRLLASPTYAAACVLSLALGIGAVAAAVPVVYAVLLRPLPYPGAGRLVAVRHSARLPMAETGLSAGTLRHYRAGSHLLEAVAVHVGHEYALTDPGEPAQVRGALVSPGLFALLKVAPELGAPPSADDTVPGAPMRAYLAHDLWVERFGASPGAVGRTVELGRKRYVVAGVMPPGFRFPDGQTRVWLTWALQAHASGVAHLYMDGVARLKPGVALADAERELQGLLRTLPDRYGDVTRAELDALGLRVSLVPLRDSIVGDARPALLLLGGTAGLLLLITWANAVNLALVRAEALRGETAVERALGAAPRHLAMRFFAESGLLSAAGGGLGALLALAASPARFGLGPERVPRLGEGGTAGAATVAAVAAALAAASALLLGLAPLLHSLRGGELPGSGSRATSGRGERTFRWALVAGQVALALTMAVGAALLARSYREMQSVRLGFEPAGVTAFRVPLPPTAYGDYHAAARVHAEVLRRVRALPGVETAEAVSASGLPLTPVPSYWSDRLALAGRPAPRGGQWPPALVGFATPGYFGALRIPLLRGRSFQPGDMAAGGASVILSAALARELFGGADPVGRHVRWADPSPYPDFTVVGVAGDVPGGALRDGPSHVVYFPNVFPPAARSVTGTLLDYIPDDEFYLVRSRLPAAALVPAVRRSVREVDPKLVIARVATLPEVVAQAQASTRLTMALLLAGAGAALLVAMVGVYGLLSYSVRRRTPELGVRMAMGASPGSVVAMVMRQAAVLLAAGTAAGLVAALVLARFIRALLFQVSPADPAVLVSVAALLAVVGLAGSCFPALRAGRIDPVRALRAD